MYPNASDHGYLFSALCQWSCLVLLKCSVAHPVLHLKFSTVQSLLLPLAKPLRFCVTAAIVLHLHPCHLHRAGTPRWIPLLAEKLSCCCLDAGALLRSGTLFAWLMTHEPQCGQDVVAGVDVVELMRIVEPIGQSKVAACCHTLKCRFVGGFMCGNSYHLEMSNSFWLLDGITHSSARIRLHPVE